MTAKSKVAQGLRSMHGKAGHRKDKMHTVMSEYAKGELHSGSKKGPVVHNRKQAIAIGLSEARRSKRRSHK